MILYLVWLLDITINNASTLSDLKRATEAPIHKGRDWLVDTNYCPVSLTSVVCEQMELGLTGYLRQVWDMSEWLYEDQWDFTLGYSWESKIIIVCQDIADSLDERARIDTMITDSQKLSI